MFSRVFSSLLLVRYLLVDCKSDINCMDSTYIIYPEQAVRMENKTVWCPWPESVCSTTGASWICDRPSAPKSMLVSNRERNDALGKACFQNKDGDFIPGDQFFQPDYVRNQEYNVTAWSVNPDLHGENGKVHCCTVRKLRRCSACWYWVSEGEKLSRDSIRQMIYEFCSDVSNISEIPLRTASPASTTVYNAPIPEHDLDGSSQDVRNITAVPTLASSSPTFPTRFADGISPHRHTWFEFIPGTGNSGYRIERNISHFLLAFAVTVGHLYWRSNSCSPIHVRSPCI